LFTNLGSSVYKKNTKNLGTLYIAYTISRVLTAYDRAMLKICRYIGTFTVETLQL